MTQAGKELTVPERAAVALNSPEHEKQLRALVEGSKQITAITNADSYTECHSARMNLKRVRVEIEKKGKLSREDAQTFAKGVIAEEKRLIAISEPEETRLAGIQQEHDTRIERERRAKAEAEAARLAVIQQNLADLVSHPSRYVGRPSADIEMALGEMRRHNVALWAEGFLPQAEKAKADALAALELMLAGTLAQEKAAEDERAKIAAERAEYARLKAEADERDRQAAETARLQAEENAKRQAEIEAAYKASQAKIEAEARAAQHVRDEADRKAAAEREVKLAEIIAEQKAEQDRLKAIRAAEDDARQKQYAAEAAKRAQEDTARALAATAQADREAALRAEACRQEQEKRNIERAQQELLATDGLLGAVRLRIGSDPRYAKIAAAIDEYMSPGRPIAKPAKRQGGVAA